MKKKLIKFETEIKFVTTSKIVFKTLNSFEKSFDFGWDRTRITRLAVRSADHSATRDFIFHPKVEGYGWGC